MAQAYILALEGGGSRSQAAVMDYEGRVLHISSSAEVNTNFTAYQDAQQAVRQAVAQALEAAQVPGEQVRLFVSALVGPRFGAELFGSQVPNADYQYYGEGDVVFAGAGIYRPHGVALVGSTGATAWGVRADDGRSLTMGGWGALLGDEGSAYAAGLLGLRAAVRSFEGRDAPTALVDALCQHFGIQKAAFQPELIRIAYRKPLSRAEIAALAVLVTRLAAEGDAVSARIVEKVAHDLAALALHAARRLFSADEAFPVAAAGGLLKAGPVILQPLESGLAQEFPRASIVLAKETPAVALGRLAIYNQSHIDHQTQINDQTQLDDQT